MRFRLSVLCLLFSVLSLTACTKRETPVEEGIRTHTLLLGNGAEPQHLDPQLVAAYTDMNIGVALFEGLTAFDEKTSQAVPAVAERWETSADGLTWTFHLRPAARWSNGEPLTADDFVQSWRRMLLPTLAAEGAYVLYPLKNAEAYNTGRLKDASDVGAVAVDAHTLRVVLEHPTPHLPIIAAQPAWYPLNVRVLAKFGGSERRGTAWTNPGNLVGNGPFLLTEWKPNARLVVEKNSHYWDAARTSVARIVFFPTENPSVEERDFRAGQLHLTAELPLSKVDTYRQSAPASLRIDPFLEVFFLRFNTTRAPFSNPQVRQALTRAIDRASIARNILRGTREPAEHYTPPNCAGYTPRARVATDFAEARRLLAAAGFPDGKGFPAVEVQVRNDEIHPKVMEAIQAMWLRELGIKITLAAMEQKTWLQNMMSLNYTVSTARWIADFADPVSFLEVYTTGNGFNMTGWSNASFDQLIKQAAQTADAAQRLEFFQQAEAMLLAETPIAPVFFGARTYLAHPAVHGWAPAALGLHRYPFVRLEN
ncbi:MAG: peptide ABC transporter substrate-binding protein [Opitutus sp.]|nr:peptide ABC transporter substrate-binding protein [Opitutus sp.]